MPANVRAISGLAVVLCLVTAVVPAMGQQAADTAFVIDTLAVTGTKRYKNDQVVQISGLKAGVPIRLADLEAAARRMADTGMFNNVSYRYATANNRVTVTLEIEEASWTMPVVFDNFVGLTDEQLIAEVSQDMPTFDGTAPTTNGARDLIVKALQKVLQRRSLPGTVEVLPHLNMKTGAQAHLFKVTNPAPRICSVRLAGASAAMERELGSVTGPLAGTDYSRSYFAAVSAGTLLDVYRKQGYWTAKVSEPQAGADAGCGGVAVTLPIEEGPVFLWDGADWGGIAALPADQLTKLLPFRPGDVADGSRLDAALRAVRDAYGTVGHLSAAVTSSPRLTVETRRVRFALDVKEGPQFRMGTLTVNGLGTKDAETLQKKWPLKPGDVFNTAAVRKFSTEEVIPLVRRLGLRPASPELKQGAAQTVDAVINFRK